MSPLSATLTHPPPPPLPPPPPATAMAADAADAAGDADSTEMRQQVKMLYLFSVDIGASFFYTAGLWGRVRCRLEPECGGYLRVVFSWLVNARARTQVFIGRREGRRRLRHPLLIGGGGQPSPVVRTERPSRGWLYLGQYQPDQGVGPEERAGSQLTARCFHSELRNLCFGHLLNARAPAQPVLWLWRAWRAYWGQLTVTWFPLVFLSQLALAPLSLSSSSAPVSPLHIQVSVSLRLSCCERQVFLREAERSIIWSLPDYNKVFF